MPRKNTIEPEDLDQGLDIKMEDTEPAFNPPHTDLNDPPSEWRPGQPGPKVLSSELEKAGRMVELQAQASAMGKVRNENKVWVSAKTQKCICVRKCFHPPNPNKPETSRLYNVGDELVVGEGQIVPRHFIPVDSGDPRVKAAKDGATPEERVPPFVQKARKIVN